MNNILLKLYKHNLNSVHLLLILQTRHSNEYYSTTFAAIGKRGFSLVRLMKFNENLLILYKCI